MKIRPWLFLSFLILLPTCDAPSTTQQNNGNSQTLDPVCHKSLEDFNCSGSLEGKKYFFCGDSCKKLFVNKPYKYLSEEQFRYCRKNTANGNIQEDTAANSKYRTKKK